MPVVFIPEQGQLYELVEDFEYKTTEWWASNHEKDSVWFERISRDRVIIKKGLKLKIRWKRDLVNKMADVYKKYNPGLLETTCIDINGMNLEKV